MLSIILQTERLLLRPPVAADISKFVPLIGDFDVAKNLSRAPIPSRKTMAARGCRV